MESAEKNVEVVDAATAADAEHEFGASVLSDEEAVTLLSSLPRTLAPLLRDASYISANEDFTLAEDVGSTLSLILCHLKSVIAQSLDQREQIRMLSRDTTGEVFQSEVPVEIPVLQELLYKLKADLGSSNRVIAHLRAEREKAAIAFRTVTSHQARESSSLRKKLKELQAELADEKKARFSSEHGLQSCMVELRIANENFKESRSMDRVAVRRLTAAVEREKQERKKSSTKYTREILNLRRDAEQLLVELQSERSERARDVKGNASSNESNIVLRTNVSDWQVVVDKLEAELYTMQEAHRKISTEATEERSCRDAAYGRLQDVSIQLLELQGELGDKDVELNSCQLEHSLYKQHMAESIVRRERLTAEQERSIQTLSNTARKLHEDVTAARMERDQNLYMADRDQDRDQDRDRDRDEDSVRAAQQCKATEESHLTEQSADEANSLSCPMSSSLSVRNDLAPSRNDINAAECANVTDAHSMLGLMESERNDALADMRLQELQHLEEMEAIEANLEAMGKRLKSLSAENESLRFELSQHHTMNDSHGLSIDPPPPPCSEEAAAIDCAPALHSLEEHGGSRRVELVGKIHELELEVIDRQYKCDECQRELAVMQTEHEQAISTLKLKLDTTEKYLFQKNEAEAEAMEQKHRWEQLSEELTAKLGLIEEDNVQLSTERGHLEEAQADIECLKRQYDAAMQLMERDLHVARCELDLLKKEVASVKAEESQMKENADNLVNALSLKCQAVSSLEEKLQSAEANARDHASLLVDMDSLSSAIASAAKSEEVVLGHISNAAVVKLGYAVNQLILNSQPEVSVPGNHTSEEQYASNAPHENESVDILILQSNLKDLQEGNASLLKEINDQSLAYKKASLEYEYELNNLRKQLESSRASALRDIKNATTIALNGSLECMAEKLRDEVQGSTAAALQTELNTLREALTSKNRDYLDFKVEMKQKVLDQISKCNEYEDMNCQLMRDLKAAREENILMQKDIASIDSLKSRNVALSRQLSSVPPSIAVAQAEKRVLEERLQQLHADTETRLCEEQKKSAQIQFELNAFMRREELQQSSLLQKIQSQAHTIHQLSRHVQLVQSNYDDKSNIGELGNSKNIDGFGVAGTGNPEMLFPWPLSDNFRMGALNLDKHGGVAGPVVSALKGFNNWNLYHQGTPDDYSYNNSHSSSQTFLGDCVPTTNRDTDPSTALKFGTK